MSTGSVLVTKSGQRLIFPSVNIPSDMIAGTNGAGDAFAAGALYGLHQEWRLEQVLELAHAAAAASMRHIGTTDSMMEWSNCLDLASKYGWRARPEGPF